MKHDNFPVTTFSYRGADFKLRGVFEEDYIFKKILKRRCFYELDFLEFFRFVVSREGVVIDAGANIGNHSIYFSRVMKRRVLAFEPNAATFDVLDLNCKENFADVARFNVGLSEKSGFSDFVIDGVLEKNVGMAKLGEKKDSTGCVRLISIDEFLHMNHEISNLAAIKIDVEGYEESVLNGAMKSISKHKPSIFVECQDEISFQAVSKILEKLDYIPHTVMGATPMWHFAPKDRHMEAIRSKTWSAYRTMKSRMQRKTASIIKRYYK